jgi:hypothetical protein
MTKTRVTRGFRLLEVVAVLGVLAFAYGRHLEAIALHEDEGLWIATSCYWEALLDRHFIEPEWLAENTVPPTGFITPDWVSRTLLAPAPRHVWAPHYWTLTQPPMARYTIALGRWAGGYGVADLNTLWKSDVHNRESGSQVFPGLLWYSRAIMALLAVLSGLILFLLVRQCAGAVAGYAFVVLFAMSDFLLTHLRRAMTESPLLFFTCLMLVFSACFLSADRRGRALVWLTLMGIAAGLAGATKLNGLALAGAGMALVGAVIYRQTEPHATFRRFLLWTAVLLLAVSFTFTVVNPFLYPNPPVRTVAMLLFLRWETAHLVTRPEWSILDLANRLRIIPRQLLEAYTVTHRPLLNLALLTVGLYALGRGGWQWWRRQPGGDSTSVALLAVAAVTALPPLLTPLDWGRYYLYSVVFISVGIAVGIGQIVRVGQRLLFSHESSRIKSPQA